MSSNVAHVLIVDDEQVVRDVIRRALVREGFSCAVASCTSEASAYLREHEVHLITLDVDMPGQSGLEWLPWLTTEFPDISVVMLTAVGALDTAVGALTGGASDFLTKPVRFEELVLCVRRVLECRKLQLHKKHYTQQLEEDVRSRTELLHSTDEQMVRLLVLASLYRDEETGAHIGRVGESSALLAAAMGWTNDQVIQMRLAAPLHDVGKIGVPDGILQKRGKLTSDEFDAMKLHVAIGAKLLSDCESPTLKLAAEIALNHHERWDGLGYLNGLSGTAIPQSARIVAVVDVYDALTHDRVYRPALPEEQALTIMREGRASQFDPEVFDAFLDLLPFIREIGTLAFYNSIYVSNPIQPLLDDRKTGRVNIPISPRDTLCNELRQCVGVPIIPNEAGTL